MIRRRIDSGRMDRFFVRAGGLPMDIRDRNDRGNRGLSRRSFLGGVAAAGAPVRALESGPRGLNARGFSLVEALIALAVTIARGTCD